MERPLLIITVEDLVLVLALLAAVALALTLWRRRGPPGAAITIDAGIADPASALGAAHAQLRALEAIEARTLRAVADHSGRIQAMRQHFVHGTAEEQALLDTVQRLTFAAIAEQHDRALEEALAMRGENE